jgi:hypothetical protein
MQRRGGQTGGSDGQGQGFDPWLYRRPVGALRHAGSPLRRPGLSTTDSVPVSAAVKEDLAVGRNRDGLVCWIFVNGRGNSALS